MSKFTKVYPGQYTPDQQEIMDELNKKRQEILGRDELDINALVSGKIKNYPVGVEKTMTVTREEMMFWVKYDPENPLYWDEGYAKKAGFDGVIGFPTLPSQGCHFYGKVPQGMGDLQVVDGLCQSRTFHRPVYEGDELYLVMDDMEYRDITPKEGSDFRTIMTSGSGKLYNQKGELVMEGHGRCRENLRTFSDPAEKPAQIPVWQDPDWQSRPVHHYTDQDWDYIRSLWEQEPVQSQQELYYEDVEIGTMLPRGVYGPVFSQGDWPIFYLPVEAAYLKRNITDPQVFPTMIRDEYDGIYRTPEEAYRLPAPEKRDKKRPVFENSLARQFVAKTLINWAGEKGWLYKIDWRIMPRLPDAEFQCIPQYEDWPDPLERVPGMQGRYADHHGLSGDICEIHAYVADKYEKGGRKLVDIVWWCTTIDQLIYEEGTALVELPSRN